MTKMMTTIPTPTQAHRLVANWVSKNLDADTPPLDEFDDGYALVDPATWQARGEEYGLQSLLVIVHDGGPMAYVLGLDPISGMHEQFSTMLDEHDLYVEQCTGWYSAIYPINPVHAECDQCHVSVLAHALMASGSQQVCRDCYESNQKLM